MANANTPFGLRPINDNGTPFSGQLTMYYVPSSLGTAVFIGDPVIPNGDGDAYGVAGVTLATAGTTNYLIGSVVAIVNGPAVGGNATIPVTRDLPVYHAASTAGYVLVADDPNQLFVMQEDSIGGAIAATALSSNFSMVSGVGSTTTGQSGWMIDSSVSNTTSLQLRLMRLLRGPDNAIGTYAKWVVRINQHSLWNTTGI